jgi:dipeptidyl-peptidase 4
MHSNSHLILQYVAMTCMFEYAGTNGYCLSKDGKYAVHTLCSAEHPVATTILALPSHTPQSSLATNARLCAMHQSLSLSPDSKEQELAVPPIEFFKVPISNDVELDAWCIYPPQFDASQAHAYPVIFYVYGEPAACTVRDRWAGKVGIWHRMLAQRGAVVMSVDNRGTPSLKGAAWRKHIYKSIGSNPSADQAMALATILDSRSYLDPERVAIWGWSGGGSMSLNLLFRYPSLYHTAVSVAPVPDMRLYDTIYQERYMGE